MTNDPIFERWRERSWRRKLTSAEQAELRAWLAAHPEAQAEWEAEMALNDVLDQLPDAPVASNFTARAVAAVEREKAEIYRLGLRWMDSKACRRVLLTTKHAKTCLFPPSLWEQGGWFEDRPSRRSRQRQLQARRRRRVARISGCSRRG